MSLAGFILMIGIALWFQSALALGMALVLFLVFHLVIVFAEEPGLENRFGESYREYKRHVPRWLPRLQPWSGSSAGAKSGGR